MYDADNNVNGKYPNLAFYDSSSMGANSNFWKINTFNAMIRNLTIGYEIPQKFLSTLNVQRASLGVTGNNLWYFNNPYPDNYRNNYDNSFVGYPTLRTWSVNLSVSF